MGIAAMTAGLIGILSPAPVWAVPARRGAEGEGGARAYAIDRANHDGLQHVKIVRCYSIPAVAAQSAGTWDR